MITKSEFVDFIQNFKKFEEAIDRIDHCLMGNDKYSAELWESDWYIAVCEMFDTFINSHFTEAGADWINYSLFETIEDKIAYIKQPEDMFEKEKEIEYHLNTIDELWDFLNTDKKLYFKNVQN